MDKLKLLQKELEGLDVDGHVPIKGLRKLVK
jgi:hypothetical protein